MKEPSNIFAKDLGIDITINPIKNSSVYKQPVESINQTTGKSEYTTAEDDIALCIIHDKDGLGDYNSDGNTIDSIFNGTGYSNGVSIKISKQNTAFSFAEKFNEYLINSKFKNFKDFNKFIQNATGDIDKLVYERTHNLANNITNVDTCKWRYLSSTYELYSVNIHSIIPDTYPQELDFLLDIFSIPREYILNNYYKTEVVDNDIIDAVSKQSVYDTIKLVKRKYYNNFYEKLVFPAVKQELYKNYDNDNVKDFINKSTNTVFDKLESAILSDYKTYYYPTIISLLSVDAQNLLLSYFRKITSTNDNVDNGLVSIDEVNSYLDLIYGRTNSIDTNTVPNDGHNYFKDFIDGATTIQLNVFNNFLNTYLPPDKFIKLQKIELCARQIVNMCSKLYDLRKSIKDILIKDSMIGTGLLIEELVYEYILDNFTKKIGILNSGKLGPNTYDANYIKNNESLSKIMKNIYSISPSGNSDTYYEESMEAKSLGVEFDNKFNTLKVLANVLDAKIIEYNDTTHNYLNIIPPEAVSQKQTYSETFTIYPPYLNVNSDIVYCNYQDLTDNRTTPNPIINYDFNNKVNSKIIWTDYSTKDKPTERELLLDSTNYPNENNSMNGQYYWLEKVDNNEYKRYVQWQDDSEKDDFMSVVTTPNINSGIYINNAKLYYNNTAGNYVSMADGTTEFDIYNAALPSDPVNNDVSSNLIASIIGNNYYTAILYNDEQISITKQPKIIDQNNNDIIVYSDSIPENKKFVRLCSTGDSLKHYKSVRNGKITTIYDCKTFKPLTTNDTDDTTNNTFAVNVELNEISYNKTYNTTITEVIGNNPTELVKSTKFTLIIDDNNTVSIDVTKQSEMVGEESHEYYVFFIQNISKIHDDSETTTLSVSTEIQSLTLANGVTIITGRVYYGSAGTDIIDAISEVVANESVTIEEMTFRYEYYSPLLQTNILTIPDLYANPITYDYNKLYTDGEIQRGNVTYSNVINKRINQLYVYSKNYYYDDFLLISLAGKNGDGIVLYLADNTMFEPLVGNITDNSGNIYYSTSNPDIYGNNNNEYTYDYNTKVLTRNSDSRTVNDYRFDIHLVYNRANEREQTEKREKIVKEKILEGNDPFWNELVIDGNNFYGDLTIEDERAIVMFYKRIGLINDALPVVYKNENGGFVNEWAIARAKIIDILKSVWTNYAQHTWYNEVDDEQSLSENLMSEATINMLKQMDIRYGSNLGNPDQLDRNDLNKWEPVQYSLVNLQNYVNHTVAVHPFIWNLVERTYDNYLKTIYISMYDNEVLNFIYKNESSYILEPGQTINSRNTEYAVDDGPGGYSITDTYDKMFNVNNWAYYNRDFSGYTSQYQESLNQDSTNTHINRYIDFDGPFNFEALMDIVTMTSESDEVKQFDDTYLYNLYKLYYDGNAEQDIEAGRENAANNAINQVAAIFTKYYIDCDI